MGRRRTKSVNTDLSNVREFKFRNHLFGDAEEKGCTGKYTYYNEKDAADAALMVRVRGEKNVYPYICVWCQNWHIGHKY
jgi:hypothetical protein